MPEPSTQNRDLTRREVLRRAAIVVGGAWAAPVIQSISTPAFAQVTPQGPGGCPCIENNVTTEPCGDPATGTWTLTLPPGCTFHGGGSKCASDLCEPAVDNGDGTITFSPCLDAQGKPKCISNSSATAAPRPTLEVVAFRDVSGGW